MLNNTENIKLYNLGILQGRSYRILEDHLSTLLKRFDLIIPEWKLLGLINDTPYLKISQMAKKLDVEGPFITRLANSLEKKGLISRTTKKEDLRTQLTKVTEQGENIIPQIESEVKLLMNQLLNGTTPDNRQKYLEVLKIIVENGIKLQKIGMVS